MPIIPFKDWRPKIHEDIFLAPDAWITGNVTIEKDVSIFFGVVIRGDILPIKIGEGSNIQEHAMIHTSHDLSPTIVGKGVTIGHRALIHGCTIKDSCIIGMGSTILDGAEISEHSIVGANSLVTMNKIFPPRSMIMGSPAKVVRELTDREVESIKFSAKSYVETGKEYMKYFLTA